MARTRYLIGIDEAGRGPLAGPVSVGAVLVPTAFDWGQVEGARDSKKMTPTARGVVYAQLQALAREKKLRFSVALSSARTIDRIGIVPAIRRALARAIVKLDADPRDCTVLLDGGLVAPEEFIYQETIVRGDDSEPVISLASIAAKVHRDRLMVRLGEKYPKYSFETHKGYGTALHRQAIQTYGLCAIHRRAFCTSFT